MTSRQLFIVIIMTKDERRPTKDPSTELGSSNLSLQDITPNTLAAKMEGSFFSWDSGSPNSKFGGEILARLILMEWGLNQGKHQSKLSLNALLFEHGRALLAETFFTESIEGKAAEVYLGSTHCYRLNIEKEDYTEAQDEALMTAIFFEELGVGSHE